MAVIIGDNNPQTIIGTEDAHHLDADAATAGSRAWGAGRIDSGAGDDELYGGMATTPW